ncbi:hypothetical protein RCH06_000232 [Polaromonas sp. CG_9.5]|uniref:hypothetical protein n=1 Tax=Polaromonas sp. CG_9.5 TaxID=3071705 RepID=UPI002E0941AD|nr:hypothetical protein [Polaromonas sp. CG_9.5]
MISFSAHAANADLRRGLALRVPRGSHDAGVNFIFQDALCRSENCGQDGRVWRSSAVGNDKEFTIKKIAVSAGRAFVSGTLAYEFWHG